MSQPLRDADAFTKLKEAELYVESDCFAVLNQRNTILMMPVYLRRGTSECFILSDGRYLKAESLPGFQRYQLKNPPQARPTAPADPPEQANEPRNFTEDYRAACRQKEQEALAALAERQQSRRAQSRVGGSDAFQEMARRERQRISEAACARLRSRGRG